MENNIIFTNQKGCALLAAIDAGFLPESGGSYDTAPFEKFWSLYLDNLAEVHLAAQHSKDRPGDDRRHLT